MIVRINQIDPKQFEGDPPAVWPADGPCSRIHINWSPRAYEVLILDQDEDRRPMDQAFRQRQLRTMIPLAAAALSERGQVIVLRFDGPASAGELLPVVAHLSGSRWSAGPAEVRYACTEFQKLHAGGPASEASVRVAVSPALAGAICGDENVGLSRSVRLRALAVPAGLVAPLLDVSTTDDERWEEILPHSPFLLTTTPQLRSIRILSSKLDPAQIRTKLTQHLTESTRGTVGAHGR